MGLRLLDLTTLILISCYDVKTLFIRENVIFDRISERADSKSSWTVSLIMDLHPYRTLMTTSLQQVTNVAQANEAIIHKMISLNDTNFRNHFYALDEELDHLNKTIKEKFEIFMQYDRIGIRNKRSLIPFIGDVLNFAFGTTTDKDLNKINQAVNTLNMNQEKIQHVVGESLSLINVSHNQIIQNRNRINKLNTGLKELLDQLSTAFRRTRKDFVQVKLALNYYFQLSRMVEDARELVAEPITHFESFQVQIDVLALGRITPHVINPTRLLAILNEIKNRLPENLKLPMHPTKRLWDYYKILTCSTVFRNEQVLVIMKVPLVTVGEGMILYRVHNLPLTNIKTFDSNWINYDHQMVAQYELEAAAIAINKRRTRYILLSEEETNKCAARLNGLCEFRSPSYPINQSKYCLVALITNDKFNIKKRCRIKVRPNEVLPQARQVSLGVWAVSVAKRLKFTIICDNGGHKEETIEPPLGIIKQTPGCDYNSNDLKLTAHYEFESLSKIDSHIDRIQRQVSNYSFTLWEPFDDTMNAFNKTWNLQNLEDIEEIKMTKLINELNSVKRIGLLENKTIPGWAIALACAVTVVLLMGFGFCMIKRKWGRFALRRLRTATILPTVQEPLTPDRDSDNHNPSTYPKLDGAVTYNKESDFVGFSTA